MCIRDRYRAHLCDCEMSPQEIDVVVNDMQQSLKEEQRNYIETAAAKLAEQHADEARLAAARELAMQEGLAAGVTREDVTLDPSGVCASYDDDDAEDVEYF
eukprot:TRINITY_DN7492_c0_g1_i1.p1 TRINITY_DN7492_c0_g1~~TRINITY_DN7492_c0_g1_i1.p1  ORF type:complete len:101 (-),score=25.82 TRINITY_DN7492_c0_g1_i1:28-330(-)